MWNAASTCQEGCSSFPNVECYFARTFGEGSTIAQVCAAAADKVAENEVCFSKNTAQTCLRQAGCDWIAGRLENGREGNWCALDVDYTPAAVPCSDSTCDGCLADRTCVWMNDETCSNSCDNFPNIDCYYPKMFGATTQQNAAVCNVANNNSSMVEHENCFNQTGQDACFGVSGCAWIGTGGDDGFCSLSLDSTDGGSSGALAVLFHSGIFLTSLVAGVFLSAY